MQKIPKNSYEDEVEDEPLEDLDDICDDDYGFILDASGNLKSVLMPEDYTEIPEQVFEVFKLFGITDMDEIYARIGHTIH